MSSLLEQAIIDARTLKETARKNAEAAILEKYSSEIKQSIETLLEQDEPAAAPEAAAPEMDMAAGQTEEAKNTVEKIPPAYLGENNMDEIELDLDSLVNEVDSMKKQLNIADTTDTEMSSSEEKPVEQMPTRIAQDTVAEAQEKEEEPLEESFEVDEQIAEELTIDIKNVAPGGINANTAELQKQMSIAKALATQLQDLKEHLTLKDAQIESLETEVAEAKEAQNGTIAKLQETKEKLKKSMFINMQLKESFEQFSQKLNEVNIINARLLYSNKVLRNASLNERQRDQIAEAISNASTVEEAKTVYETLQKSMQTVVEKRTAPQSLSEALSKAPSPFLPRKSNTVDPTSDRWKLLAGIKK